jgi:hypothetical protein
VPIVAREEARVSLGDGADPGEPRGATPDAEPTPDTAVEPRSDVPEPPGEPNVSEPSNATEPEAAREPESAGEPQPPAQPHIPTVAETIQSAVAALVDSGDDLRLLSTVAVAFGVVFVTIPFAGAFGFAITAPLYAAFGPTLSGSFVVLSLAGFAAFIVAFIAFFVFTIQFPMMVVAMVGGRIAGRPLALREAVRRARQCFWRSLRASILIGLITAVPSLIVTFVIGPTLGPTQLATGLNIVTSVVLSSPWVYVLPGIVLGGVGAREALRRSWRLARFKWRLALTIAGLGVIGGQIVVAAASAVIGSVATIVSLTPGSQDVTQAPAPVLLAGGVVLAGVVVTSLFFATQAVEVAPETSGFYALTGYASGLDEARGGTPEPLLRWPARLTYAVGLIATIVLVFNVLSTWPVAERGPWQRWVADGITLEVPVGWRKQFEDPAGAAFGTAGGSVSVEFEAAGSTTEALALRHLVTVQGLPVESVTEDSSEDVTIDGRVVREVVATAQAGEVPVPFEFRMVMEIGSIGGHDVAFIVDCPASSGFIQDFYTSEAKRFARHIWTSATPNP